MLLFCGVSESQAHKKWCKEDLLSEYPAPDAELLELDTEGATVRLNNVLAYARDMMVNLRHVSIWVQKEDALHLYSAFDDSGQQPQPRLRPKFLIGLLEARTSIESFKYGVEDSCEDFTRQTFDRGGALAPLASLTSLHTLSLIHMALDTSAPLTQVLRARVGSLRKLRLASLIIGSTVIDTWPHQSTEDLVDAISALKNLVSLQIAQCALKDSHLEALLDGKEDLRILEVSGGFGVQFVHGLLTDAATSTIVRLCPRLQGLSLDHNRRLTEVGVETIVMGCPHLRELHISRAAMPFPRYPSVFSRHKKLILVYYSGARTFDAGGSHIRDTMMATGGRTLFVHDFEGLQEFSDLPSRVARVSAASKRLLKDSDKRGRDHDVCNKWEALFDAP